MSKGGSYCFTRMEAPIVITVVAVKFSSTVPAVTPSSYVLISVFETNYCATTTALIVENPICRKDLGIRGNAKAKDKKTRIRKIKRIPKVR